MKVVHREMLWLLGLFFLLLALAQVPSGVLAGNGNPGRYSKLESSAGTTLGKHPSPVAQRRYPSPPPSPQPSPPTRLGDFQKKKRRMQRRWNYAVFKFPTRS
uniref:Uncharacterized protein n=1 Tax=Rhipicephalus appendiculatus TaxID=34631 RepID=A0A131YI31_RHIAP